jgi:hypothetical protein
MKEMYYVISPNEGDVRITQLSKEELIEKLDCNYWGDSTFVNVDDSGYLESDLNYWNHNDILIIKGKVVIPEPIQVVKTYEIE